MPSALEMVMMLGRQAAQPRPFQPTDIFGPARDMMRVQEQKRHALALEQQAKANLEEQRRQALEAEEAQRQQLIEQMQARRQKGREHVTSLMKEQMPLVQHPVKGPAARATLASAGVTSHVSPYASPFDAPLNVEAYTSYPEKPMPEPTAPVDEEAPMPTPIGQAVSPPADPIPMFGMGIPPFELTVDPVFAEEKAAPDKSSIGGIPTNAPPPTPKEEMLPVMEEISAVDSKQQGQMYRHFFSPYGGYIGSVPIGYLDKEGREGLNMAVKGLDTLNTAQFDEGMRKVGDVEDVVEGVTDIVRIKNANKRASSMTAYRTRGEESKTQKGYITEFDKGVERFDKITTKLVGDQKINSLGALEESSRKLQLVKQFIEQGGDNIALVDAARYIIASMREPGARLTDKDIQSTEGIWSYAQELKQWLAGRVNPDPKVLREKLRRMKGEIDIVQNLHRKRMQSFVTGVYKKANTHPTMDRWRGFNSEADASFDPEIWPWVEDLKRQRDLEGPNIVYGSGDGGGSTGYRRRERTMKRVTGTNATDYAKEILGL